jgi:hypothetical protein
VNFESGLISVLVAESYMCTVTAFQFKFLLSALSPESYVHCHRNLVHAFAGYAGVWCTDNDQHSEALAPPHVHMVLAHVNAMLVHRSNNLNNFHPT